MFNDNDFDNNWTQANLEYRPALCCYRHVITSRINYWSAHDLIGQTEIMIFMTDPKHFVDNCHHTHRVVIMCIDQWMN